jgi:putative CocE/NonD family hydrolase
VATTPGLRQESRSQSGPLGRRFWRENAAADGRHKQLDLHAVDQSYCRHRGFGAVTAKLIDVYPPSADYPHGFAMNLTEGLLRVRYRDSWERPVPIVPGEVYAITIELFPVANLFCRGHQLRLDISSSNFPHFDVNPNSGEPEGSWQQPRIARNRVFAEAKRPSHILLPVIPPDNKRTGASF